MLDLKKTKHLVEKKEIEGEVVYVRHLTMLEIDEFTKMTEPLKISKSLIKNCLCDEAGNSLNYSDEDLDRQPASLIKKLAELIMACNDLSEKKS